MKKIKYIIIIEIYFYDIKNDYYLVGFFILNWF